MMFEKFFKSISLNRQQRRKMSRKEAGGGSASAAQFSSANAKKLLLKSIAILTGSQGRGDFAEPEYDLEEYKLASEGDSYVRMAESKYRYLIFKAGYELKGVNKDAIAYLKTRFKIMSFLMKKPIDVLFQEVADDLIRYSNAFLIKVRVDKLTGGIQAKGLYGLKPIGGYVRIDPRYVQIKRDKYGNVTGYMQSVEGEEKKFGVDEVIHIYMDKEANNAFGTPRNIAALEDVKLLRKIEGNTLSLVHRFSIPIYHWIIGSTQQGQGATESEIDDAIKEIESMYLDGSIVTSERTNIKALGAEGHALDVTGYLKYFEQRVFSALGTSDSMMGRGGAKQDADSMESQVHDTVKYIQRMLSMHIDFGIITELLIEGGYDPIFNPDDIISMVFNEISIDTKIKVENHEMLKFQSDVIDHNEARSNLGINDPIEEDLMYSRYIKMAITDNEIEKKTESSVELANVQAENAAKQQNQQEGNGEYVKNNALGGNGKSATSNNKDIENRNKPSNQHGTYSAKVKESFIESYGEESKNEDYIDQVFNKYYKMRNNIAENVKDKDTYLDVTKISIVSSINRLIDNSFYEGVVDASNELDLGTIPNITMPVKELYSSVEEDINNIFNDLSEKITIDATTANVCATCDALSYRLRYCVEYVLPKAYWFAYIKTGEAAGKQEAYVTFNSEKDAEGKSSIILTNKFKLSDIPAYHSFCKCSVSFKKGDDL